MGLAMSDLIFALIALGLSIVLYSVWPLAIFGVLYMFALIWG